MVLRIGLAEPKLDPASGNSPPVKPMASRSPVVVASFNPATVRSRLDAPGAAGRPVRLRASARLLCRALRREYATAQVTELRSSRQPEMAVSRPAVIVISSGLWVGKWIAAKQ